MTKMTKMKLDVVIQSDAVLVKEPDGSVTVVKNRFGQNDIRLSSIEDVLNLFPQSRPTRISWIERDPLDVSLTPPQTPRQKTPEEKNEEEHDKMSRFFFND